MTNIKSSEELFDVFITQANNIGLDTKLWATIDMYFENLDTQGAWMLFVRGYMMGCDHATKEAFK